MRIRTRAAHAAAAISAVVLVSGFVTDPAPASRLGVLGGNVDDLVHAAVSADGEAPVIVRLRDQAELGELVDVADAAAETLTDTVEATTHDVDGLLAALTAPAGETPSSTVDGVLSGVLGGTVDVGVGDPATDEPYSPLDGTLHGLLGGALDPGLVQSLGSSLDATVHELAGMARANAVVDLLHEVVAASAGDRASVLDAGEDAGTVSDVREFWIFNGFAATVDDDALYALADHPAVASVHLDEQVTLPDSQATLSDGFDSTSLLASFGLLREPQSQSLNWGVDNVGAPKVWDEYGVRGEGVVVGIMDSGVDARHPALVESWRGTDGDPDKSWFVSTGERYPEPGDGRGHGTHITGAIVGQDGGNVTGVAPGAEWIAAKIFNDSGRTTVSAIHRGFEWMLAPGGDPSAAPDIVNNSWGTNAMYDREFWSDVDAWIAAGIVPVFATGNRGPRSSSISSPASFPHVIAVGASNGFDRVASFSSRGPVTWGDARHTKPDVVAPGYRIRSAWPTSRGGGYRLMTGTSMATPHVSGVAALLRSADPDASVREVRRAIERAARPGQAWNSLPDNEYGNGIVNAPAAMEHLTR